MESSFPLQDGQINKLRILSEVYTQKKKKNELQKKSRIRIHGRART